MEEIEVVTVFLRHRGEVLLLRRSAEVGSYAGQWGTVAGHLEGDALDTARSEIEEETGLTDHDVSLVTKGPSFPVVDEERGTRWIVHPFLFDAGTRKIDTNWETNEAEWTSPTALLRRDTVPELWTSYRRVAPSVVDLRDDTTHGSAYLSVRALEILRDRAGLLATTDAADIEDAQARLIRVAERLLDARPTMAALANRIHRVLHESRPEFAPATVEQHAHTAIGRALDAERKATRRAADVIGDQRVLTLSRSGTVMAALQRAAPASVVVATSHPGGEGVAVAEALADDGLEVTLCPDAALAATVADVPIDLVLVGADTIRPSGAVVNKTGTRAAALAARHGEVPFYAACSIDKVAVEAATPGEQADRQSVYDGPADLHVHAPRFDVTPTPLVTGGIVTERGVLSPDDVPPIAAEMETLRDWG